MNKHRMNQELASFAARLRELIANPQSAIRNPKFSELALELFALQFRHNPACQKICRTRGITPEVVEHWTQIPAVPTGAFKELELSCLPPEERTAVFRSSGTTEQRPSRHFHNAESLAVYEASLWAWFNRNVLADLRFTIHDLRLVCLAPRPAQAPHSSLVHMFETVRRKLHAPGAVFVGNITTDGDWTVDFDAALAALGNRQSAIGNPKLILGTAFSLVHLLDFLVEKNLRFNLPAGSRVMETGGYKNRSRVMPKAELHALITEHLGVPPENIVCEYGMSELSSQAYDSIVHPPSTILHPRVFHFPPWARAQIISPENGREVADGETGLIRVFDLANVFSVVAVQTEDLGVRHGDGFELLGRAQLAEPRGCSLMSA
jgi:Acyl-protein synthetase, LuxE